jgi:vanillate O-demethylase monooxygenase subunit
MDPLTQEDLAATLAHFWHPVCTVDELPDERPLAVTLLGHELAVARLANGGLTALADRCPHRSTRLSVGTVDGCALRCAYHGWTWAADGGCTSIPSLPDGPIPAKARVTSYEIAARHGLVWVRLEPPPPGTGDGPPIPHSSAHDSALHTIVGTPYTWPVSPLRRVENFVDLAHFAFVHDGSLGRRDEPVPPLPDIGRVGTELRFVYEPPDFEPDASAMYGTSVYRLPMPCTVDIDFRLATGARRVLWMTASPVDASTCRVFWAMARDDDLDEPGCTERDDAHLAFQRLVLEEDEPVVCGQTPPHFPLDPAEELSVPTDLVSNLYRRWVREMVRAYVTDGAAGLAAAADWISADNDAAASSSSHDARTASRAISTMSASS